MTSTEQTMKKCDDSVDVEISCGVERNRFKGLPSIYEMSLTKQKMEERNDDVDVKIICGEKNRFKELPTIYKMSSTKQTMKKRNDDVEASVNLLDSMVPDINVPIMKPSKPNRFNFKKWIDNAKTKISENVKRKSSQIANWILNTTIVKSHLPAKIKELIKMVIRRLNILINQLFINILKGS